MPAVRVAGFQLAVTVVAIACLYGQQPALVRDSGSGDNNVESAVSLFLARDYVKAGPLLSGLADRGDAFAAWLLMRRFSDVYPAAQMCDPGSPYVKLSKILAEHGVREAFRNLFTCSSAPELLASARTMQNPEEAAKWGRKMQEAKLTPDARAELERGFAILRRHAEAGSAIAQLYCHDIGVDTGLQSHDAVESWLRKSADKGPPEAEYALAERYKHGRGSIRKDMILALSWMRKAADHNYAPAQFSLGLEFQYGRPLTKNLAEARRWYRLAAQNKTASLAERAFYEKALKDLDTPAKAEPESAKPARSHNKTDDLLKAIEEGDIAKAQAEITNGAKDQFRWIRIPPADTATGSSFER